MDIIETIRYLNNEDGPQKPLRAIDPYCGVDHSQLSLYLNGKARPKDETRLKMEQGIRELMKEIQGEGQWLL